MQMIFQASAYIWFAIVSLAKISDMATARVSVGGVYQGKESGKTWGQQCNQFTMGIVSVMPLISHVNRGTGLKLLVSVSSSVKSGRDLNEVSVF